MNIEEFIEQIKPTITYKHSPYHDCNVHYMGSTILTNKELDAMLIVSLEESYTKLNYTQRKKIRQKVFKEVQNE
jgi:hypothetical protein